MDSKLVIGFVCFCIAAIVYMMFLPTVSHKAPPQTRLGYHKQSLGYE